jgi:hypothetical protein
MIRTILSALCLAILLAAAPAHAQGNQAAMRCVLREVVAAVTCKPVAEIRLIGQRDEVFVFNVHYGSHFTEFYCQVFDRDVVVTSKSWKGNMASARLNFEVQPGCITATVNSPWEECHAPQTVQCCGVQ